MKKFIVEDSFWDLLPQSSFGVIIAKNLKPTTDYSPEESSAIARMLDEANALANQHLTSNTISENEVVAIWRQAYKTFKTKKGARCSIENLLKRVLKGNPVGSITPLVDMYNAISLKYALPVGGEDIDTFAGDLRLGVTEGGDAFHPLGEDEDDPTLPGEVCYRDNEGAVCRCFNWRDGQRTALTDESSNAFFIIECVDGDRIDDVRQAVEEFEGMLLQHSQATIFAKGIITKDNPDMVIG